MNIFNEEELEEVDLMNQINLPRPRSFFFFLYAQKMLGMETHRASIEGGL